MSRKLIDTLFYSVLGVVAALALYNKKDAIVEGFAGMMPMRVVNQSVSFTPQGGMYAIPGQFEGALPPRFSGNLNYGASLRYKMPDVNNMALDPNDPMMSGKSQQGCACPQQAKIEGYCTSCGTVDGNSAGCRNPDVTDNMANAPDMSGAAASGKTQLTNMLVQNMGDGTSLNALGDATTQPVVFDRPIYAPMRNRQLANANFILGDLPIAPTANAWFKPQNSNPAESLQQGFLQVLGGYDTTTSADLQALKSAYSLVPQAQINMVSDQSNMMLGPGGQDVKITAFP